MASTVCVVIVLAILLVGLERVQDSVHLSHFCHLGKKALFLLGGSGCL